MSNSSEQLYPRMFYKKPELAKLFWDAKETIDDNIPVGEIEEIMSNNGVYSHVKLKMLMKKLNPEQKRLMKQFTKGICTNTIITKPRGYIEIEEERPEENIFTKGRGELR